VAPTAYRGTTPGVSELPDIKIFHHGRPSNFEAAASTTNIVRHRALEP